MCAAAALVARIAMMPIAIAVMTPLFSLLPVQKFKGSATADIKVFSCL
jgi:hypothetical protein